MCTAVLIGRDPATANPHPPALGLVYEGAIGQRKQTTSVCDPLTKSICDDPPCLVIVVDELDEDRSVTSELWPVLDSCHPKNKNKIKYLVANATFCYFIS
jgi:hypothetical protein